MKNMKKKNFDPARFAKLHIMFLSHWTSLSKTFG